jgi:hypothetical protein
MAFVPGITANFDAMVGWYRNVLGMTARLGISKKTMHLSIRANSKRVRPFSPTGRNPIK